jgi:hypothetical protein
MAIVEENFITIGVPRDDHSKLAIKVTYCSIPNIVEVEPFTIEHRANGNGHNRPKKGRGK